MRANQNKLHQTFVQAAMSMTDTSRLNQLLRVDLQCGCSHACHQLTSHCVIVFFSCQVESFLTQRYCTNQKWKCTTPTPSV
jgi:hypothetical protein